MHIKSMIFFLGLVFFSISANADLVPFKDYDISDSVWSVTVIKVKPNMTNSYLEGIKNTWATGNDIAKELGQIEDYWIYQSDLPQSGDFNLMLIVKFKDTNDLTPSKEKYDAFMKKFGEKRNREVTDYAQKNYPAMRKITGQYNMREITLK